MNQFHIIYIYIYLAATIGFELTSYTVDEVDGVVVVGVALLSGDLSREVVVRFNTMDDSATSTGKQLVCST